MGTDREEGGILYATFSPRQLGGPGGPVALVDVNRDVDRSRDGGE